MIKDDMLLSRIEFLMAKMDINKPDIERGSGIPYSTIVAWWRNGTQNMKLSTLLSLADFLVYL
ncbi:helix-turn-helix domain-containing protein [Metaclostridioides mangenotii]|uniref:helix-turn-helix domain-containing protein n=1 Tax=Metaclostridioides mangenotii TaxID=1540 RepID=UPI0004660429|nr:helix-turn-helix transcriptional regulator [Clostridioides mangenotii]